MVRDNQKKAKTRESKSRGKKKKTNSNQSYYFPSINNSFDKEIEKVLKAMLKHIAFDGWPSVNASKYNHPTINHTAASLRIDPSYIKSIFHFATELDFIQAVNKYVDKVMIKNYKPTRSMSITDKVYLAVKARLDFEMQYKVCFQKSMFYLMNPINYNHTLKMATRTASIIWQTIGIKEGAKTNSSRAASLSLVLVSTWLYWLGGSFEKDNESEKVLAFMKRRLDDVVAFGKIKSKLYRPNSTRSNVNKKNEKPNQQSNDFKVRYLYNNSKNNNLLAIISKLSSRYIKN